MDPPPPGVGPGPPMMPLPPDEDCAPGLIGFIWAFASVTLLVLSLRLVAALAVVRNFRPSEYLMVAAYVCATVCNAFLTACWRWGLGRHVFYLSQEQFKQVVKTHFISQGWAIAGAASARISCCVFLLGFVSQYQRHRWPLIGTIVLQALVNSIMIIIIFAECGSHLPDIWEFSPRLQQECLNINVTVAMVYTQCAINSLTDLYLVVLPSLAFRSLQIRVLEKIGLVVLFSLAFFAFVASIVKVTLINRIGDLTDYPWNIVTYEVWAAAEAYVIILCGSVPMLKPFVRWAKEYSHRRGYAAKGSGRQSSSGIQSGSGGEWPLPNKPVDELELAEVGERQAGGKDNETRHSRGLGVEVSSV